MTVLQDKKMGFARNVIAIFARAPRMGEVKTRLAKSVGDQAACDLYVAMLRDVFASAQIAASHLADAEVVVFYTPESAFSHSEDSLNPFWNGAHYPQCDGDLGDKLFNCFKVLRENGAQNIVVIGTDAPDLPPHFLNDAFRVLEVHDFVFGASEDGGFYLMGASLEYDSALFADVRWSSEHTLQDVLTNLGEQRVGFLPLWRDVDTIEDLRALHRRLQIGKGIAQQTHRVLDAMTRNEKAPRE